MYWPMKVSNEDNRTKAKSVGNGHSPVTPVLNLFKKTLVPERQPYNSILSEIHKYQCTG